MPDPNPFTIGSTDTEKIAQGNFGVPEEINIHKRVFGKEPWEVSYDYGYCHLCNSRIDEFGYCACGGGAD
jgi:hypothetical protein